MAREEAAACRTAHPGETGEARWLREGENSCSFGMLSAFPPEQEKAGEDNIPRRFVSARQCAA